MHATGELFILCRFYSLEEGQRFIAEERLLREEDRREEAQRYTAKHRAPCVGVNGIAWYGPLMDNVRHVLRSSLAPDERALIYKVYWNEAHNHEVYIGGTQFPLRRYVGDQGLLELGLQDMLLATGDYRPMFGHMNDPNRSWTQMIIFAVRCDGHGALTEVDAIRYAKYHVDPEQSRGDSGNPWVRNAVADSRGLSKKYGIINFLYICFNRQP